jgi:hypothetical protein
MRGGGGTPWPRLYLHVYLQSPPSHTSVLARSAASFVSGSNTYSAHTFAPSTTLAGVSPEAPTRPQGHMGSQIGRVHFGSLYLGVSARSTPSYLLRLAPSHSLAQCLPWLLSSTLGSCQVPPLAPAKRWRELAAVGLAAPSIPHVSNEW